MKLVIAFSPIIALTLAMTYCSKNKADTEEDGEKREYFSVSIPDMANGKNFHTHVEVTGRVKFVRQEGDGDTHIVLVEGLGFIVAECIPELPCVKPKRGQIVTVKGISRFDGEHKWYEVHPVESLVTR